MVSEEAGVKEDKGGPRPESCLGQLYYPKMAWFHFIV